jgi:holo-[acyl-carrier protein] synthase
MVSFRADSTFLWRCDYTGDMRIIGHGIDIVDTARVGRLLDDHAERFMARCFTQAELAYVGDQRKRLHHLAGRFAAKEAILKALGTGWRGGILWTDAEIIREPSGQPRVELHGKCKQIADALGIDEWWVSISHIATHATASAIAVSHSQRG